ncbi:MAG: PfkB family carbohydrate kinase [Christensenellales bacterium]
MPEQSDDSINDKFYEERLLKMIDEMLEFLEKGFSRLEKQQALLGFDGFVDRVSVIKNISEMDTFSDFLKERHGMSGALELVPKDTKIGGNMPITAHALGNLGVLCTGIGAVGKGEVDSIFSAISTNCNLIPVTDPGKCLALEFKTGKLMLSDNSSLLGLDYSAIVRAVGAGNLLKLHNDAKAIAYVNWSELPHMNAIFDGLLKNVYAKLEINRMPLLLDFSDCTHQDPGEIKKALRLMARLGKKRRAVLSMNHNEYQHLASKILSLDTSQDKIEDTMASMRDLCGIENLVIRMDEKAYALSPEGFVQVDIVRVDKPKLLTGAGDNYNAGLLAALMMGGTWEQALIMGTFVASYYIQFGKSATPMEIIQYIISKRNQA